MDGSALQRPLASWSGEQVRFMTAGSVDDGKSTLIGRLLLDAGALMRDQVDSVRSGEEVDLAALTDGLEQERAQGITIDVAYRYFATPRTSFIIADAPGHEQYTRNMVSAASVSDVAVIVIDASRVEMGELKPQTRRHAAVAALLGLNVIVAVNKMDLVDWSESRFEEVRGAFDAVARRLGIEPVAYAPVSAKHGDNIVHPGGAAWRRGLTLVELLEASGGARDLARGPLRLPVQTVLRHGDKRYYAGRVESGSLRPGDKVRIGPSAAPATIAAVRVGLAGVAQAEAGASVAVELAEDRDLARGGVIAGADVVYARHAVADLCWLDDASSAPVRRYRLRQGALETHAVIAKVRNVRDMTDLSEAPADVLELNDIASVEIKTRDPILADMYADLPGAGAFVLIDPDTNQTAAAGMIRSVMA